MTNKSALNQLRRAIKKHSIDSRNVILAALDVPFKLMEESFGKFTVCLPEDAPTKEQENIAAAFAHALPQWLHRRNMFPLGNFQQRLSDMPDIEIKAVMSLLRFSYSITQEKNALVYYDAAQTEIMNRHDSRCKSVADLYAILSELDWLKHIKADDLQHGFMQHPDRAAAQLQATRDTDGVIAQICSIFNFTEEQLDARLRDRRLSYSVIMAALDEEEVQAGEVNVTSQASPTSPHYEKLLSFMSKHPPEGVTPEFAATYLQAKRVPGRPSKDEAAALQWLKDVVSHLVPAGVERDEDKIAHLESEWGLIATARQLS